MSGDYRLGEWLVESDLNRLSRGVHSSHIEPLAMDVLVHLLVHQDRVVSVDELLDAVWTDRHGDPGMVKKRIAQIRAALDDDARHPRYIENIPKRGYRVVASVSKVEEQPIPRSGYARLPSDGAAATETQSVSTPRSFPTAFRFQLVSVVCLGLAILAATAWLWRVGSIDRPSKESEDLDVPVSAIAVLPFDDLSPSGNHAWLADGLAEDLAEALGRVDGLFIAARRSAAVLKNQGADLRTIGERLGVGSVVVGSVRRVGEQVTVTARWRRVEDDDRLWSARFDRKYEDILAIQFEIATGVSEAIRTELGIRDTPEWITEDRYSTVDVRAWELLKRATYLAGTGEPSNVEEARELLLTATKYDPTLANAHALLAWVEYISDVERGIERLKLVLELDPSNPGALATLAWDSAMRLWDYESAIRFLKRIPENRKSGAAWGVEFNVYSNLGLQNRALPAAEQSARHDPMFARAHCFVGALYMGQGDEAAAIDSFKQAIAVAEETEQWGTYCVSDLAKYYLQWGRKSEALGLMLQAPQYRAVDDEVIRRGWELGSWKGMHLAIADAYPSATFQDMGWQCDYITLAEAGAAERMYSCLETELEKTAPDFPALTFADTMRRFAIAGIRIDDAFEPYRAEPRFQTLLDQLDERIRKARGTYAQNTGFTLTQKTNTAND